MEATLEAKINVSGAGAGDGEATTDVFDKGTYGAARFTVKAAEDKNVEAPLPVDVFVVTPTTKGTYPVLLFCHGWKMTNEWYSNIFEHIASHGYIVVAPQFYTLFWNISIPEEISRANGVTEWLSTGLLAAFQKNNYNNIYPDVENNLVVSGHSRGGKVAFGLVLGETGNKIHHKKKSATRALPGPPPQRFRAVIGIDPVGGKSPSDRPDPKIFQYIPRCFDMCIPVAVIGTGYGSRSKGWPMPPCAPDGVNHAEFFNESKPPICYFLATEFGHFDMMDDNIMLLDLIRSTISVNGDAGSRGLMRKATGGAVVAFLRAYLGYDEGDLDAIVDDPRLAPIVLEPVLHVKE